MWRDRGKGRLQDEAVRWIASGQLYSHGSSQRPAKVDDAVGGNVTARAQVNKGRVSVPVGPLFCRSPFASPIAPIVEEQNAYSKFIVEELQVSQAVADVSGVSMEPEPGHLVPSRHKPSMEYFSVGGGEGDIFERQADVGGVSSKLLLWKVYEVPFNQTSPIGDE